MKEYKAIGVMSGTSLDGVDLAYCRFIETDGRWQFHIEQAETIPYTSNWKYRLGGSMSLDARGLALLHVEFGRLLGTLIRDFINKHKLVPDVISSHGHTVFHQPDQHFTFQIGSGAEIASQCGISTICDFRTTDVALGGQGAPLVPVGDDLLFQEYDFCLNLGGFANISFQNDDERLAYDICPANIVLNKLSQSLGHDFDDGGKLAASGMVDEILIQKLNHLDYYSAIPPKSLGVEWLEESFIPVLSMAKLSIRDQLRTLVEHFAMQIAESTKLKSNARMLVTGGGVHNLFLIERIAKRSTNCKIIIPEENIINYKEALIFAFLGILRLLRQPNCLKSVTGASRNNVGGAVYLA